MKKLVIQRLYTVQDGGKNGSGKLKLLVRFKNASCNDRF